MLNVQAMGFVTADLEPKESEKGPYVSFSLAVHKGYGEREHTVYLDCRAFGQQVSRLTKAKVSKGSGIWVAGDADLVDYTRKDGTTGRSLRVTVSEWGYLPFRKNDRAEVQPSPPVQEPPDPVEPPEINGDYGELP